MIQDFTLDIPILQGEAKPTQLAEYCGFILEADKNRALIEMKNRFFVGMF